jgi:hypothetical protein
LTDTHKALALWCAAAVASAAFATPPSTVTPGRVHVPFWPEGTAKPETVQAKLNGEPARVLRLQGPGDDLFLILVLDLAGDLSLVDPAREALIASFPRLPPKTTIALMRAQDGLRVVADPGTPLPQLTDSIRQLTISGRAGLLDTVQLAVQLGDSILAKARVRVAILYITDSNIANYREDYTNPVINSSDSGDMSRRFPEGLVKDKIQQIRTSLSGFQSPVFIVHLDYRSDRLNEAYQTGLLELATVSGGAAEFCRSASDIPESIGQMLDRVSSLHTAEVEAKPSKARQLDVELDAEGTQLRYRTHYRMKGK